MPPATPQFDAQAVYDDAGNFILNLQGVGSRAIELAGPNWKIVPRADQLGVDPQMLTGPKDGALDDIVGCQLPARFPDIPRLAFKRERGRAGARRQPIVTSRDCGSTHP